MQKATGVMRQDYGTDCKNCELYGTLGDVCVLEHGKKFLWEYCRDFVPKVVLPDYNQLMREVKQDQALERQKLKEKKEKERKKKLKEKIAREEERRRAKRARQRRKREQDKKKQLKLLAKHSAVASKKASTKLEKAQAERRVEKAARPKTRGKIVEAGTTAAEKKPKNPATSKAQAPKTPRTASSARATA